jgi:hypothetical protein
MELDTDGSVYAQKDHHGRKDGETSAHDRDGHPLDANAVNYFVLPDGAFMGRFGINLGDIAAVIFRERLAFACLGDIGPPDRLGEGSIALHRALGFERVPKGKLGDAGIDRDVVTIVFPNSGLNDPTNQKKVGVSTLESQVRGVLWMAALTQTGDQFEQAELARLKSRQLKLPADRPALLKLLRWWVEDVVASTPHPLTIEGRDPVDYLLATADGLDVLQNSSSWLFQTVYADLRKDTDADGRWYVRHITFSLNRGNDNTGR